MLPVLECRGAPRDLGFDQGVACAREAASALAVQRSGARAVGVERDLWRHFPHLAERCAGLARGARVSRRALARAHEAALEPEASPAAGRALALLPERSGAGPRLVRAQGRSPSSPLRLRRSEPDSGYRSLELTEAFSVGALAGVNEAGLAAAVTVLPAKQVGPCAAPALLLVQDCLQHLDAARKAADWCLRRPAGGRAALIFADAEESIGVFVGGEHRSLLDVSDGLLVAPAPDPADDPLEKALSELRVLDPETLPRCFPACDLVWLDPVERRLGWTEDDSGTVRYRLLR